MSDVKESIRAYARALGFDLVGFASAEPFHERGRTALERVRQGLMGGLPWYNEDRVRRGAHPRGILPGARSIICVAVSHLPHQDYSHWQDGQLRGRVARYAWGRDYHRVMERRLRTFVGGLPQRAGREVRVRVYVDSGPVMDRAVAERAGVGWFGKSTNILSRSHGSWVLLGTVITDLELEPDPPLKKTCGACRICIDRCPTGAIIAPYVLDNRRCISYLTIELRGPIPRDLRHLVGDWVFGCDVCQEVCPVNLKARPATEPAFQPGEHGFAAPRLLPLLELTDAAFQERFRGTSIMRAKRVGLRRNVCVALGNLGDRRAVPALAQALREGEHLVRTHAAWALGRIGGGEARHILKEALAREADAVVRGEIGAALEETAVRAGAST